MTATETALTVDWLAVCRQAVEGLQRVLADAPTTAERARETGTRGSGGDRTLLLDAAAEDVVFEQLDRLARDGYRFHAVSEERGEVDFGSDDVRVVIDPIDGSLNAKRSAPHYALSVAVADGSTMADVAFGFVHDFGAREQFWAWRGQGAWIDRSCGTAAGRRLDPTLGERRNRRGRLELVGIESADPRYVRDSIDGLVHAAHRLRALGAVAITLCEVAAARMDGMVTLIRSRGVDAAAGQLIVREAGGVVSFPDCDEPLGAPLDSNPSSRLVAARTERGLHDLERVVTP
jgi:myo-inositol-1(or 4)-monophosphatase